MLKREEWDAWLTAVNHLESDMKNSFNDGELGQIARFYAAAILRKEMFRHELNHHELRSSALPPGYLEETKEEKERRHSFPKGLPKNYPIGPIPEKYDDDALKDEDDPTPPSDIDYTSELIFDEGGLRVFEEGKGRDRRGLHYSYVTKSDGPPFTGHPGMGPSITGSLDFQYGPISRCGSNGLTSEAVLTILRNHIQHLNNKSPCKENKEAMAHIYQALKALNLRTHNRRVRGVEGKEVL